MLFTNNFNIRKLVFFNIKNFRVSLVALNFVPMWGGSGSHLYSTRGKTEKSGEKKKKNKGNIVAIKYVARERQRHTRAQMVTGYYHVYRLSRPYEAGLYLLPLGTMEFT